MKVLFMRHGESKSQAKLVKNTDPDSWNTLTEQGIEQVANTAKNTTLKINAVYSSPHARTVLTANTFIDVHKDKQNIIIDERLREIDYGFHGGDTKNHPEMIEVATKQIAGDYDVRFGRTGENKREIVTRFFCFLIDTFNSHKSDDIVLAVTHGRAISIVIHELAAINNTEAEHGGIKNAQIKEIDLTQETVDRLVKHVEYLNSYEIKRRCDLIEQVALDDDIVKPYLLDLARKKIDDIDVSYKVLELFVDGLYKSNLTHIFTTIQKDLLTNNDVILITAVNDSADFINHFIKHYIGIGVTKFVFIDNDSKDDSIKIIKKMALEHDIAVDIWYTQDKYNGRKLMGWRRRLMEYYGLNRWYLSVDSDELFVCNRENINDFIKDLEYKKMLAAGAIMIDMYPDSSFANMDNISPEEIITKYKYFDIGPYKTFKNRKYRYRVFGGPRGRLFDGISPSLQKFPLIFVKKDTIGINPHFWYPYHINSKTAFITGLLHYKFLPGYRKKYKDNAENGLYYNNSSEYKVYFTKTEQNLQGSFYDPAVSKEYTGFDSLKSILE